MLFIPKSTFAISPPLNGNGYQITLFGENGTSKVCDYDSNSDTICFNDTGLNVTQVRIKTSNVSLIEGGNYELFSSIIIGSPVDGFTTSWLRDDKWVGNYNTTTWKEVRPWWNVIDSVEYDALYRTYGVEWGSVYQWTDSFASGGMTFDFYFQAPLRIAYVTLIRFDLVNNGNSTSDSVNNAANSIIANSNKSLGEINASLTDETEPNVQEFLNDLNIEPSTNPVSDLLTMPITLLQAYLEGFRGTCTPFSLGTLLGHELVMPCIKPFDYLGTNLSNIISSLFDLFLCYNIGLLCISIYESITSLDDNVYSLYTPRHGYKGYKGKHGGGE